MQTFNFLQEFIFILTEFRAFFSQSLEKFYQNKIQSLTLLGTHEISETVNNGAEY